MEQKKKIAFVSNTLWSIFHFRFSLIRRLLNDGYSILILAPDDETRSHFADIEDLEYIPLQFLKTGFASPSREWKLFREIRTIYQEKEPDLIFHYTIKPNILGSFAAHAVKKKSIAVVTGMGYAFASAGFLRLLVIPLYRKAVSRASQVWFLNEGDKIFFIRKGIIGHTPSFILPGEGVDSNKFSPEPGTASAGTAIHFLMISRLLRNKGVNEFIAAADIVRKKFPQTLFTIIGAYDPDSPDAIPHTVFEQLKSGRGISYLSKSDDIRVQISKSDCVVLPSYAEGLSMALMEAASMEKPIIATNVSGCRELVLHGISGYLSEPRNAEDLAEKMILFISQLPENKLMMGKNGRKLMLEKYELQHIIRIYQQNIRQILH